MNTERTLVEGGWNFATKGLGLSGWTVILIVAAVSLYVIFYVFGIVVGFAIKAALVIVPLILLFLYIFRKIRKWNE